MSCFSLLGLFESFSSLEGKCHVSRVYVLHKVYKFVVRVLMLMHRVYIYLVNYRGSTCHLCTVVLVFPSDPWNLLYWGVPRVEGHKSVQKLLLSVRNGQTYGHVVIPQPIFPYKIIKLKYFLKLSDR
jgi:hypothetical protein